MAVHVSLGVFVRALPIVPLRYAAFILGQIFFVDRAWFSFAQVLPDDRVPNASSLPSFHAFLYSLSCMQLLLWPSAQVLPEGEVSRLRLDCVDERRLHVYLPSDVHWQVRPFPRAASDAAALFPSSSSCCFPPVFFLSSFLIELHTPLSLPPRTAPPLDCNCHLTTPGAVARCRTGVARRPAAARLGDPVDAHSAGASATPHPPSGYGPKKGV